MSRAPYDRFQEERSDTSKSSWLSGARRRDVINWGLLAMVIVGSALLGILSPIAGVLVYLYAPGLLGLLGIFVASGAAMITAIRAFRTLLLDILDRIEAAQ